MAEATRSKADNCGLAREADYNSCLGRLKATFANREQRQLALGFHQRDINGCRLMRLSAMPAIPAKMRRKMSFVTEANGRFSEIC
jgi:hypothetical protein